jgi:hypothetical protein
MTATVAKSAETSKRKVQNLTAQPGPQAKTAEDLLAPPP